MGDVNLPYAKDFLEKINKLDLNGELLCNSFFLKDKNIWHTFQQTLFEEIKIFSKSKIFNKPKETNSFEKIRIFFYGFIIFIITAISIFYVRVTRRKFFIFTLDRNSSKYKGDFRLDPLYEAFNEKSIFYGEIVHTVLQLATLKNWLKNIRPVIFIQSGNFLFNLLNIFGLVKNKVYTNSKINLGSFVDIEERKFAAYLIEKYINKINSFNFITSYLRKCISFSGVTKIFLIDDVRTYNEVLLAAEEISIETYALQHGHYTNFHVGWIKEKYFKGDTIQPKYLLIWNKYWKKELETLGSNIDSSRVIVAGLPKILNFKKDLNKESINVLIPYETSAPKNELKLLLSKVAKCPDVKIHFKFRADRNKEEQLKEYGFDLKSVVATDTPDFSKVNLVIGTYSTYLYDMVAMGIPVLIAKTSSPYGKRMVENKIADEIDVNMNVCDLMNRAINFPIDLRLSRAEMLGVESENSFSEYIKELLK